MSVLVVLENRRSRLAPPNIFHPSLFPALEAAALETPLKTESNIVLEEVSLRSPTASLPSSRAATPSLDAFSSYLVIAIVCRDAPRRIFFLPRFSAILASGSPTASRRPSVRQFCRNDGIDSRHARGKSSFFIQLESSSLNELNLLFSLVQRGRRGVCQTHVCP